MGRVGGHSVTEGDKLIKYKADAIQAAKELFYGYDVINSINKAKTESEVTNIMSTARRNAD